MTAKYSNCNTEEKDDDDDFTVNNNPSDDEDESIGMLVNTFKFYLN